MWPFPVKQPPTPTHILRPEPSTAPQPAPKRKDPVWLLVCNASRKLNSNDAIVMWIEVTPIDPDEVSEAIKNGFVWGMGGWAPRLISNVVFATKEAAAEYMIEHESTIKAALPDAVFGYDSECLKLRKLLG